MATRVKVKNVTSAEAAPFREALRPVYAKIFPNEAVDQIVLPHMTGIRIMLNYGAVQNDINGVYGAWAKGFPTSNRAYDEGTDDPAYAWIGLKPGSSGASAVKAAMDADEPAPSAGHPSKDVQVAAAVEVLTEVLNSRVLKGGLFQPNEKLRVAIEEFVGRNTGTVVREPIDPNMGPSGDKS